MFSFFTLRIERNETMYNGSYFYFPFFVHELGKGKGSLIYLFLFSIMDSENEKRKDDIYSTTCFSVFPFFHLAKEKTKICITDHIYIFRFFVCGLRKRKRILRYPFPIFYHEIEKKRKTKGRYIHGPGNHHNE